MIHSRTLAVLGCAMVLGAAAMPLPALADPASGRITAHWEDVYAPSVPHAVRIHGRWHAAGETYFRVDDQADAPVYSLSFARPVDQATQFNAIGSDTSAVPYLDQITSLVRDSSKEAGHSTLSSVRAAAYQIAIWHLTDGLPISRAYVPKQAIRSGVKVLLRKSARQTKRNLSCTGSHCTTTLSTAATVATISVKVGGTVNDAALRIAIITPTSSFFNRPQYVDLRINGMGATVCPGEVDVIRVDKPVTHNVLKSSCEFRAHDPSQKSPKFAGLPRLIVERTSSLPKKGIVNNVITTLIPRQDTSQLIQFRWPFSNDPGMVFMPTSPSAPVITAATFSDSRSTATTIDPADFASFQEVVQRSILPLFTGHGLWGLVLLGALLALLLVIKDVAVAILKKVWGIVRRLGNWLMRKLWNRFLQKPWGRIRSRFKRQAREAGARQDGETDSVAAGQPEDSSPT